MMEDAKLEKVNEHLYHELRKDGDYPKWEKRLTRMYFTLVNAQASLSLEIERPDSALKRNKESEKGYSEEFGWRIRGTGLLEDAKIGAIREDGTVTTLQDTVRMVLRATPDSEKEHASGSLSYITPPESLPVRIEAGIDCFLLVPQSHLESLCDEIVSGRLVKMEVSTDIDVFSERALFPGLMETYLVEECETWGSRAYLCSLTASRSFAGRGADLHQVADNSSGSSEKKSLSDENDNIPTITLVRKLLARLFR